MNLRSEVDQIGESAGPHHPAAARPELPKSRAAVNSNCGENFGRLLSIGNQYDPTNLFRLNANIGPTLSPPARSGGTR